MLAVIVVSYNTRALLKACLASVFTGLEQSRLDGTIWVVDNASSDGSPDMVRREFPQAQLLANPDNRGFAAANNQALCALGFGQVGEGQSPQAVLLLNPDTVVHGDALGQMFCRLNGGPVLGVVGPALVYPDGGFQHAAFRFPNLLQVFLDFFPLNHRLTDSALNGRYARVRYQSHEPFPIDHPLGAALMAKWEAILQVGLMDERFFMYCEEIDWCIRFKEKGWRIECVPQAHIVHYAGQSTRQFRDKMFIALWKSRVLLFDKHYSPAFRSAVRWIVALGMKDKIRQAKAALSGGDIEYDEFLRIESACQQVMEM
jgi:N-acetylglucosaminyl-diphospho-decaprenol L-rhamnosyltransferase